MYEILIFIVCFSLLWVYNLTKDFGYFWFVRYMVDSMIFDDPEFPKIQHRLQALIVNVTYGCASCICGWLVIVYGLYSGFSFFDILKYVVFSMLATMVLEKHIIK